MSWKYRSNELDVTIDGGLDLGAGFRASPRMFSTGNFSLMVSTDLSNAAVGATTELYVAELFLPCTVLATGISHFNGSNVTDNIKIGLYNANGVLLRATADTQQVGADGLQAFPFATNGAGAAATTIVLPGPATYFIGECYDGTTSTLQTFPIGSFGAGKITGLVYATNFAAAGTALTIAVPTTFTTLLGTWNALY